MARREWNAARNWRMGGPAKSAGFRRNPPTTRGNRRKKARKNPNRERLGFHYWWRRRESNPRPQVLCLEIYMLSPVYFF